MKPLPVFIIALIIQVGLLHAATPPPNDDRINAILLTGDSFTHTTRIDCATEEENELPYTRYPSPFHDALLASLDKKTVWWKWQAPPGTANSAFKVTLSTSTSQINANLVHMETFVVSGGGLESVHVDYLGVDRAFHVAPNKTYYFRGFYAPDQGRPQPDTVSLTFSGERHPIATNRGVENIIPMTGNSIPNVYAPYRTSLFYSWTPDTSGFPVLENAAPFGSRATIYPEGVSFGALEGPVSAGETYWVAFYTGNVVQNPVLIGGSFSFLPAADNTTFETRKPVIETQHDDRTELSLIADNHGREFWWTFTPTEDGILRTTTTGTRVLFSPKVFEGEQNNTTLPVIWSTVQLTANTTYTISLRTNTGLVTSNVNQTFTFFPTANQANIVDPELSKALRRAFNVPASIPIPKAFLSDLSSLRVKAFRDCDDDDCSSNPGYPLTQLDGIEDATNLDTLYLQGGEYRGHSISSLAPIKGLTKLETVRLPNALKGTDEELRTAVEDLAGLDQITWLSLEQNSLKNTHLEPISALTRLETLDIDDNQITDLSPIAGLTLLKKLDIDDNPVVDLSPLSSLQNLRDLDLNPLHNGLSSLPPLRNLTTIKVIANDLGPLGRLQSLEFIVLPYSSKLPTPSRIRDITPVANLPNFSYLSESLSSNVIRDFRPLLPKGFQSPDIPPSVLTQLAYNSKADLSDPQTAELFATAGINPNSLTLNPDDLSLLIPDGKLRWYLSGSPPGGSLEDPSPERLEAAQALYGIHIESIEGIGNAPNLRRVTLHNGWITDLSPLSGMTNLTALNFQDNFINDVTPIAHLTDISIDLRGNPINPDTIPASWINNPLIQLDPQPTLDPAEDIPDPVLRSLIRVALGRSVDSPLVSEDLLDLRTLHADFANVRSLEGLEAATNLTGLSLRNNILTDLGPVPTENLRWLRVSGNPLDQASLTLIDTLEDGGIIVDNNEETRFLSAITPSNNVVFADHYQLPVIRYLWLFPEVTTLFLSHNYLSDISELAELPNLETVHLEGNLLLLDEGREARQIIDDLRARGVTVHTESQRPGTSAEFVVNQPELRKATADALNLPFIPPSFSREQLDNIVNFDWENSAREVPLEDPGFISMMENLEFLSLEAADLSDINFLENLTALKRLDLDFNQISDIRPLRNMTQLRELDLNDNQISDISVIANFPLLDSLDIDDNCIRDIQSLTNLTNLVELELHFNKIGDITPLNGLNALEWVDLRLNGIDYSQPAQGAVFTKLESMIEFPNLYPQHLVRPRISVDGTRVLLNWTAEQKTYYQLLFSPNLEGPFTHIGTTSTTTDGQLMQFEYNVGSRKGFFRINSLANPYQ